MSELDVDRFMKHDKQYDAVLNAIKEFYGDIRKNGFISEQLNDEYYEKTARIFKAQIDHEIKHLHSPDL